MGIASLLLSINAGAEISISKGLTDHWRLQSACKIEAGGGQIATESFPTDGWLESTVPSTVLAAQVNDGVFPDPYFGTNLRNIPGANYPIGHNFARIPMPNDSPYRCGWWYRKEFASPAPQRADERVWLHFGGINYRAEIWLNGAKIADTSQVAGAYRTYDFDVTDKLNPHTQNVLAVQTFAPSENDLGVSWVEWNPAPPDKNMGLWGDVDLVTSGPVSVRFPSVSTHFTDPSLSVANLTITADLHNSTNHAVKGIVSGTAAGVRFEEPVELQPGEDRGIALTPQQFPQLQVHAPTPWWPYQMGSPHLEKLTVEFRESGKISDTKSIDFGIREISSELTANGSRLFRINGKPLLIRGGGWAQDMMLRFDVSRIQDQFRLVRDLNLNTIRLEGKLEPEEFFHLADEQGILIMAGWSCCDHWEQWQSWTPEDLTIATSSLRSQILRLRAHPSLLVWLNGSDNAPPANVEQAYLKVEAETNWPNPILSAASSANTTPSGLNGVKMTGPYDYVAPSYWYVDKRNGGAYGFNTETSPGPAIPSLASREKFLSDPQAWPPSAAWSLHYGGGEFANLKVFDEAMTNVFATPHSAADYERMSQTLEYDSERAMFEAYSRNKYDSTGVIQWMLNNAWPSMIWHLYDYYLDAGAGYYATKKACEPLHIQYSYDDHSIIIVNSTYQVASRLHAAVKVHSQESSEGWKELYAADTDVDSPADSSIRVFGVPDTLYARSGQVLFVELVLSNSSGEVVSRNFYWVPTTLTTFDFARTDYTHTPAAQFEDLSALTQLPPAQVEGHAEIAMTKTGRQIELHLHNESKVLGFQISAALRTPAGGLIAPVLWSDNWIELAPGESRTLTASFTSESKAETPSVIQLNGWNIAPQTIAPATSAQAH